MSQHRQRLFAAALALAMVALGGCGKPPESTTVVPPATSTPENVSDVDVTEHVTTALNQTDSLKGANIIVVTLNGDVRLMGVLDSQSQIDEALRIARAAGGAHTIHDELTIKK